jgi:hypothetical protein
MFSIGISRTDLQIHRLVYRRLGNAKFLSGDSCLESLKLGKAILLFQVFRVPFPARR